MRVLVCGSRGWHDANAISRRIGELPDDAIIIEGGASGADSWARWAALERGLHVAEVRPLYGRGNDRRAPLERNTAMLKLNPELVIAFTQGSALTPGTDNMVEQARRRGISVEVHYELCGVERIPGR